MKNVFVDPETGKVNFFDTTLTSNGRAMVKRSDIAFTDSNIDLQKVDFFVFITRRQDILPPVIRITPRVGCRCLYAGRVGRDLSR